MGIEARSSVSNRSVSRVVEDLVVWYGHDIQKRKKRSIVTSVVLTVLLGLFAGPITVIVVWGYDIVVSSTYVNNEIDFFCACAHCILFQ